MTAVINSEMLSLTPEKQELSFSDLHGICSRVVTSFHMYKLRDVSFELPQHLNCTDVRYYESRVA